MPTTRQYLLPGVGDINEKTNVAEYLLPGVGDINETTASAAGVTETEFAIVGVAVATGVTAAIATTVGSSAGVAVVDGDTIALSPTALSSVGIATVSGITASVIPSVLGVSGIAVVAFVSEEVTPPVETETAITAGAVVAFTSAATKFTEFTVTAGAVVSFVPEEPLLPVFNIAGTSTVNFTSTVIHVAEFVIGGVSTVNFETIDPIIGVDMVIAGTSTADFVTSKIAFTEFHSFGVGTVLGEAPAGIFPLPRVKPIERREVRMPRLPRGLSPEAWIDVSTREFDRFFSSLHYYFADNSFVGGVHTEILSDNFTITPENSIVFVMSDKAVISDPFTAIKNVNEIPRILVIINTGSHPVTFLDQANTFFGGANITLAPGRVVFLVYTGTVWAGNAI